MSMNADESNKVIDNTKEAREEAKEIVPHFQALAPALRVYEKNLLLRLDQIEQKLQANTLAFQALEARLLQELKAIQEAQVSHAETLSKVDKTMRRGIWWRRLRALIGWLLLLAAIAGALYLYYTFDWHSLIPAFLQ